MAFKVNSTTVLGDDYKFTADKHYLSSPSGFIQIGGFQGAVAGYNSGGFGGFGEAYARIDRFPFSTPFTSSTPVGNLPTFKERLAGHSSDINGYASGGINTGGYNPISYNTIDRFPFTTPFTTATDIGDLSQTRAYLAGSSSDINGYSFGGYISPTVSNVVDRFPFSTPFTTSTDIGDLSQVRRQLTGHSSSTNGYSSGGVVASRVNTIDRFPFSTPFTTATDVGDLSQSREMLTGNSSLYDGYASGGVGVPGVGVNTIDKFPFSTPFTTATDIGDLISTSSGASSGQSSVAHGHSTSTGSISRFPFSTPFTFSTILGNLGQPRAHGSGHQY